MNTLEGIHEFLRQKRLAIVGVSQKPQDFSRKLFREFQKRGYDVVPVNPAARDIEGQPCFASVRDVQPPVSAVLLMTNPATTEVVTRDCAEAGVLWVWMYRAGGTGGAVNIKAVQFCESKGITVIPGECPMMFLPDTAWFHRFHGWVKKIAGSYPR
jgi:predicted CoA-binding protein